MRYWQLRGTFRRLAVLLTLFAHSVVELFVFIHAHANFVALGSGDPALLLQLAPGHIVFLRPDQAEHISFAPILAHERSRQSQPTTGLNLGGDAEGRGGQPMNFIVEDQSSVVATE